MTLLGKSGGEDVIITQHDRLQGCFVIGKTGYGKSVLFQNMIASNILAGHGVGVLDPTGDLIEKVINRVPQERLQDVILLDPLDINFPFPLNLFACPDPTDPIIFEATVENVMNVFAKIWGMSAETPRLRQYVRNITVALIGTPYSMVEIPHLLTDKQFREKAIPSPNAFWKSYNALPDRERLDRIESTWDRIDDLIISKIITNIVGQSGKIDFRDIIDSRKILLVRLYIDREDITSLLGSIIIGELLVAALSRHNIPEHKRVHFNLYADEFSYFATKSMGTLLTQARKYRIASTVATQVLEQLGDAIRPKVLQAGSLIVFQVSAEDAEELSGSFNFKPAPTIKPPPVIPANVLEHMNRHPEKNVREFWQSYIEALQQAQKGTERYVYGEIEYPSYNFGGGEIEYSKRTVVDALQLVNKLLYEAMLTDRVNMHTQESFLALMAKLLGTTLYFNNRSQQAFDALLEKERKPYAEKIAEAQRKIAEWEQPLTSDDAFLEFAVATEPYSYLSIPWSSNFDNQLNSNTNISYFFDIEIPSVSYKSKTVEQLREAMRLGAEINKQLRILDTREKCLAARRARLIHVIAEEEKRKAYWEQQKKESERELHKLQSSFLWWKKDQMVYYTNGQSNRRKEDDVKYYIDSDNKQIREVEERIKTLWETYGNDEAVLSDHLDIAAGYLNIYNPNTRMLHVNEMIEKIALLASLDTPEKILAYMKQYYITRKPGWFSSLEQNRQKQQNAVARLTAEYERQKAIYEPFKTKLDAVLQALMQNKIEVPNTQWQETIATNQTHADKRNEIANALGQLPLYTAMVKTPKGEWTIKTIKGEGLSRDFQRKKDFIITNTRQNYCRPRKEVEREIASRIRPDNNPLSQRKHTL